jgi:hypothetical protein
MKRYFLAIPAVLFILLNACSAPPAPAPTPTNEPDSGLKVNEAQIFTYLNMNIEGMEVNDKFNLMEHIKGPSYQVVRVRFPPDKNGIPIFHVETRCECAEDGSCCNSNRTFVITLMAMDGNNSETIISLVPSNVQNMEVYTYDHANPGKVISAPWPDVIGFLHDQVSGLQLAAEAETR